MKLISKQAFFQQFAAQDIALDRRYNPPQTLRFDSDIDLPWSWDMPERIKALTPWITAHVDATSPAKKIYLYPRADAWSAGDPLKVFQMAAIFSVYGLKPIGEEVVEAEDSERDAVEMLLFLSLVYGGTVADDIFLIPDHAKVILYADHHESVHANSRNSEFMETYLRMIPEIV